MKTQNQKYRRFHWWKYIDWEKVFWTVFLGVVIGTGLYAIVYVISQNGKQSADANDSIADTALADSVVVDSTPDSTLVVDFIPTKSDTVVFDTVISDTRVVVKSNRPVKVVVK